MRRQYVPLWMIGLVLSSFAGCRAFGPCLDHYGCFIDHCQDHLIYFDNFYCPRCDISRAGKPDWCGPINRHLGCRRCDCVPEWERYDECWLYPPSHPYGYPGAAYPGSSQMQTSAPQRDAYESESIQLSPQLTLPAAPEPNPPE